VIENSLAPSLYYQSTVLIDSKNFLLLSKLAQLPSFTAFQTANALAINVGSVLLVLWASVLEGH
jgi:hypothetical protein